MSKISAGASGAKVERWNYYFERCQAVARSGALVELPGGHGMATLGKDVESEHVFFPAVQLNFELLPGEVGRLEKKGLTMRHGKVR